MELSSETVKKWNEDYRVHESRLVGGGFFSGPDRLVVIAQLEGKTESSIIWIPCNIVSVKYDGVEPRMRINRRIREGEEMDALSSGSYRRMEMTSVEFRLPSGYRILGESERNDSPKGPYKGLI
jgi:hypothetical protein